MRAASYQLRHEKPAVVERIEGLGPVVRPILSDRGKRRLQLAAGLLRSAGVRFDVPRHEFYDALLATIRRLPPVQQNKLRAHVDWAEAYEREEARVVPPRSSATAVRG